MASPIWNEKEQRWTLRVSIDGQKKKFSCSKKGLAGKREVLAKARAFENDSGRTSKLTVNEAWTKFMSSTEKRLGAHSGAYKQYSDLGRLYILPAIGKKRMSQLTKGDYQDILDNATPLDGKREQLSEKYLKNIRATINKFVKYCDEYELGDRFRGELYIPQGHPTIGKDILQPKDIKRVFEGTTRDAFYINLYKLLIATGLRPGEGYGLKWSDIKNDQIYINRSISDRGLVTKGKNANAKRIIPISNMIREILDNQKEFVGGFDSEWIFCNSVGEMSVPHTASKLWQKYRKEQGFDCTLYGLRHTFVSIMKNSVPEQTLKGLIGHSASMTTFETYGHLVDGELKHAAEIMDLTLAKIAK